LKIRSFALALAGLSVLSSTRATTFTENFSADPLQNGWELFGNTNLFAWDSANHQLAVTWDSTQSNSYFYHSLGTTLTRSDDFSFEFDLLLTDIASGVEPGKTGPMELGFGLLNYAQATSTNFMRGAFGHAPNVAEFDYYTDGYYDWFGVIYDAPPTTTPAFVSGVNTYHYAPAILSVYDNELPLNQPVHVRFVYSGLTQTASVALSNNGVALGHLPDLPLDLTHGFAATDDFRVDMFSISSYSSAGNYYDSVLAHGVISNLVVTVQTWPVGTLTGARVGDVWEGRCYSRSNWLYTLDRSTDLQSWTPASATNAGLDADLVLQDTNPPAGQAFYHVRAQQP
jgi:hypothetical protein